VTIAAGFRCFDGVLLATDSEYSAGLGKFPDRKIWTIECGDFVSGPQPNCSLILVAAAGENAFIIDAVNCLKNDKELQQDTITLENVENAIKRSASGMKHSVLLMGVRIHNEGRAHLLRVERGEGKTRIIPILLQPHGCWTFTGTEVAESMCREMSDWMCSSGLSVLAMQVIAREMLERVVKYAAYCGPPIQTNYLFDSYDPQLQSARRVVALPEGFLKQIQHQTGAVIQTCVDASVPDTRFEQSLAALVEKLRKLRDCFVTH
jgi:hypothetical protein